MQKYIKAYYDWLDVMEALSDGERGRLITAVLMYARDGVSPSLSGAERYVFPAIRSQIDRDKKSYEESVENGKKGGRPKKGSETHQNPSKPKPKKETGENQYKDKDKEEGKEKENTPKPPDAFDEFWGAYPKKKSKGAARKAWDKLKPRPEMRAKILRSIERAKQSSDWLEADGKYIPYPATWLNAEGWEDGVEEEQPREDPGKYAKPWPEFKPGMSWEDLIP